MEINFVEILSYFVIYSFLGWILESIFRSFCEKKIINTGFLHGPVCPIYGVGAIIMLIIMNKLQGKIIEIFLISMVVLTIWEYVVGVFLEKMFNTKYWDYSDHKFNFQGRICLTNSIFWGLLGVGFINFVHPAVCYVVNLVDINVYINLIYIATVIMIIDAIISIIKVKNIKNTWNKVQELNDQIKEKLKEIKENRKNKSSDKLKAIDDGQSILEELKIKRNRIARKLYRYVYRLKKAFPKLNTKEFTEILNKKITLKRKTKSIKDKDI